MKNMINKKEQTFDMVYTISNEHDFDAEYIKQLQKETKEELESGKINSVEEAIGKMQKKYDEFYIEYMKEMLRESEEQFKNGEFITLEELKTYIDGLEAKYENNNKQRC